MDKENKKFNFRNVTSNRYNLNAPPGAIHDDLESVFNSTAYCPNDHNQAEYDLSTITPITPMSSHFDFNNELVMTAENYKSSVNNEVVALGPDLLASQVELDTLYLHYLMITTMNETLKKSAIDEEEIAMKEYLELFKANQTLEKTCFELDYEEKIIDSLLELVQFTDKINAWINRNYDDLNKFRVNFQKLAEICSKAKNYLKIENIHKPANIDFEETVAVELKKTFHIVQQINSIFDESTLVAPPLPLISDEKIDFELIEELRNQNLKLKESILKYNNLRIIQ